MTIKFGAVPTQAGVGWEDLVDVWQTLDRDSNFDSLWLMDHFVTGFGTAFGSDGRGFCRASFSTSYERLLEATDRIDRFVKNPGRD